MTVNSNVVSHDEWTRARKELLTREKEFSRLHDDLTRQIREMPAERVQKEFTFDAPGGPITLSDLFGPKSQLIVYHFMLGPDWDEGCKSCSFVMDHVAPSAVHIYDRDVSLALVSRAPLERLDAFKKRMGWDVTWVSSLKNDFNEDFQVSATEARVDAGTFEYNYAPNAAPADTELPGLSVFTKTTEGDVLHTYSTYARGLDSFIGAYRLLDVVPRGRNEDGLSYTMEWLRHHDRYAERPRESMGSPVKR